MFLSLCLYLLCLSICFPYSHTQRLSPALFLLAAPWLCLFLLSSCQSLLLFDVSVLPSVYVTVTTFVCTVGTRFNGSEGTRKFWLLNPNVVISNCIFSPLTFLHFHYLHFFNNLLLKFFLIKYELSLKINHK